MIGGFGSLCIAQIEWACQEGGACFLRRIRGWETPAALGAAVERVNSQAYALGIERPHWRNGGAIANQNTLIYVLINLRFLQRLRSRQPDPD